MPDGSAGLPARHQSDGLPERVTIWEVGARDGLQNESVPVSVDVKVEFLDRLGAAGLGVLEATSFVHPRWVPQLADADDLLAALDTLDRWPEKVRVMQANWIGKSQGARFRWKLAKPVGDVTDIEVFSTRPDTLFGASFVALAPDHPLTKAMAEKNPAVAKFIAEAAGLGTSEADIEQAEKIGIDLGMLSSEAGHA